MLQSASNRIAVKKGVHVLYSRRFVSMATIDAKKTAIREEAAAAVSKLSIEEKRRQSKIVFQKLVNLRSFQEAKRVSTFLSLDNEIDTEPIVRKIFEDGKECFVPRYRKKVMEMVKLNSMEDWETLPLTKWGIKQPSFKDSRDNALETGGLDFIVMPGVAFTADGQRLGHGGGYYDRFLTSIFQGEGKKPPTVAIAFKEQILSDLPTTERDVKIDLVLFAE